MFFSVGAQGQESSAKKARKHAPLLPHPQRTPNPKGKTFLSISTRRLAKSTDGLNSSLAQPASELRHWQSSEEKVAHAGLKR